MNDDYLKTFIRKIEGKEVMSELQQIPIERVSLGSNTRSALGDLKDLTASIK